MFIRAVRAGVQLDSDQFVAPGVDRLFQLAKRETSKEYPLPILPVHFMRNEELPMFPGENGPGLTMSGGKSHVFDRYCRKGKLGEKLGHIYSDFFLLSNP